MTFELLKLACSTAIMQVTDHSAQRFSDLMSLKGEYIHCVITKVYKWCGVPESSLMLSPERLGSRSDGKQCSVTLSASDREDQKLVFPESDAGYEHREKTEPGR